MSANPRSGGVTLQTENCESTPTTTRHNKRQASNSPTDHSPPTARVRTEEPAMSLTAENFLALLSNPDVAQALQNLFHGAITSALAEANAKIRNIEQDFVKEKLINTQQEAKIQSLVAENESLKVSLDELEQYGRRNSVRMWSKSEEKTGENTDQIVLEHAQKIGASIAAGDISRSHRVGRPRTGTTRAIIVKFVSYNKRREFYSKRKNDQDVFISEDLTKRRAELLYKARLLRKSKQISQCWSADGRILVRGPPAGDRLGVIKQINSEQDLSQFQ